MKDLAIWFKFLNFYAHNAHFKCGRNSFFSDHSYLGDLYAEYEESYDSVIERMIGLKLNPNNFEIVAAASDLFQQFKQENVVKNSTYFVNIYGFEKKLCAIIDEVNKTATLGSQNMIQGFADESESRQYKIGQRIDAEVQ